MTILLSESLISGYTTGAAVHVFTSQLKHIFGVTIDVQRGPLNVPNVRLYYNYSIMMCVLPLDMD